jgi:hypothetical protein
MVTIAPLPPSSPSPPSLPGETPGRGTVGDDVEGCAVGANDTVIDVGAAVVGVGTLGAAAASEGADTDAVGVGAVVGAAVT